MAARTIIRVGQRLIAWDGARGYVALSSRGITSYGPGESFKVEWVDQEGSVEDSAYLTLEQFEDEGITWGHGRMPWAR